MTVVNNDSSTFPNDKMQTAISIVDVTMAGSKKQLLVVVSAKEPIYLGLNRANTLNRSIWLNHEATGDYGLLPSVPQLSTGTTVVDNYIL